MPKIQIEIDIIQDNGTATKLFSIAQDIGQSAFDLFKNNVLGVLGVKL